MKINIIKKTK